VKNVDTSGFPPKLPELAPDVKAALGMLMEWYPQVDWARMSTPLRMAFVEPVLEFLQRSDQQIEVDEKRHQENSGLLEILKAR
jgi:hypothetical protein